jgi:hypothetical protein
MTCREASQPYDVPYDELRNVPEIAKEGPADFVYGPDMFDPRIIDGWTPLTTAFHVGLEDGAFEDLGITEETIHKTVGEAFGDLEPHEIRARLLEVSRRLEPKPPATLPVIPRKDFWKYIFR